MTKKTVFSIHSRAFGTHQLIMIVTVYTKPAEAEAR